jgi:hypothetical protein
MLPFAALLIATQRSNASVLAADPDERAGS